MASPQQSDGPSPGDHAHSPPPVLRLRLVPWDVFCSVTLLATLVVVAIATDWYSGFFGFLTDVCTGDECPPVPFGVDFYIYPVVWGGPARPGGFPAEGLVPVLLAAVGDRHRRFQLRGRLHADGLQRPLLALEPLIPEHALRGRRMRAKSQLPAED